MHWNPSQLQIRPLDGEPPWQLLLDADPNRTAVVDYLARGRCTCAWLEDDIVGVVVALPTRPQIWELVNVAVAPDRRGCGIGRTLIQVAVKQAKAAGAQILEIGTGNSSLWQLRLYQSLGFRIVGVDVDFFTRHYPEPIVEDGIPCRDMIRLRLDLASEVCTERPPVHIERP